MKYTQHTPGPYYVISTNSYAEQTVRSEHASYQDAYNAKRRQDRRANNHMGGDCHHVLRSARPLLVGLEL